MSAAPRAALVPLASLVVLVLGLLGCEYAASAPTPDTGWYASALGAPVNVVLVAHVRDIVHDPYYGPMTRDALGKQRGGADSVVALVAGADEVDLVASLSPDRSTADDSGILIVIHGPPSGMDPGHLSDDDGRPYFRAGQALPSGAVEFVGARDPRTSLYQVPGAWLFAHGLAVGRVRAAFTSSASPPPRLELEPGSLLSASIHRSALGAMDLDRHDARRSMRGLVDGFDEAVVGIGPGPGGEFVGRIRFASDEPARELEAEMQQAMTPDARCEASCLLVHALLLQLIDVKRDGREVSVRLHVPEAVMRSLAERAARKARARSVSDLEL
jgi:hypothetical protein